MSEPNEVKPHSSGDSDPTENPTVTRRAFVQMTAAATLLTDLSLNTKGAGT